MADLRQHTKTLQKPLAASSFASSKGGIYIGLYWLAGDQVEGGTVNIEVRGTGLLSFLKKDFSYQLCNVLPTGCPVKKGQTTITATKTLPNLIPPVSVSFTLLILTLNSTWSYYTNELASAKNRFDTMCR